MEFSDFADELFEAAEGRQIKSAPISYNARIVEVGWFDKDGVPDDQEQNKLRFSADYAYYMNNISDALEKYQACLAMVQSGNIVVWRDLNEAIARCHAHLGQFDEAVQVIDEILQRAHTFEQKTSAWYTAARVYNQLGITNQELIMRQALASLHSSNPTLWLRLGQLYGQLDKNSPESILKQYACYARANFLLQAMYVNVSGLTKERNKAEQEELEKLMSGLHKSNINVLKVQNVIQDSILNATEDLTDHQLATQLHPELPNFSSEFEAKFFSFESV